jgi:translation initiation factor 5B
LEEICEPALRRVGAEVKIPGLLVIDTPGHHVFFNLRKRGGSVADIAILVVDAIRGFEMQTYECMEILKTRRTPFLVALNKIDLIPGWRSYDEEAFLESLKKQEPAVQRELEGRLYTVMGVLSRLGFDVDRFDRITDFTKTVALVPVSAKTGEGLVELLAVLIGLTQQYMRSRLAVSEGPARGTVLEVKEEPGLGTTINAVIYDGILRQGDVIVLGGREGPIVTKVRAILLPKPLDEIRDPRNKFTPVDEVSAAAGVKIAAPDLGTAIAGAPLQAMDTALKLGDVAKAVSEEVDRIKIATDKVGVVVKADTLGSLEAIVDQLKSHQVPIRIADIGDVSKKEVFEASIVKEKAPLQGVVLAFGVRVLPDAEQESRARQVRIFRSDVVFHLLEEYVGWMRSEQEAEVRRRFEKLVKPGKISLLPGYVFRRSEPAIVGVKVLGGRIKPGYALMKTSGMEVGKILQIQDRGQAISEATSGMEVAISMREPIVGRHIKEGEVLYVKVPEAQVKALLTTFQSKLTADEREVLDEYVSIVKKKRGPLWAR